MTGKSASLAFCGNPSGIGKLPLHSPVMRSLDVFFVVSSARILPPAFIWHHTDIYIVNCNVRGIPIWRMIPYLSRKYIICEVNKAYRIIALACCGRKRNGKVILNCGNQFDQDAWCATAAHLLYSNGILSQMLWRLFITLCNIFVYHMSASAGTGNFRSFAIPCAPPKVSLC